MYEYDSGRRRTFCNRACSAKCPTRRDIHSKFLKNKILTDSEYKRKITEPLIKYSNSSEGKASAAMRLLELWSNEDYANNMSRMMTEKWADPEYHSRVNAARLDTMRSDAYRNKMAEVVRLRWATDGDYVSKVITGVEQRMRLGIKTDIEIIMEDALDMLGIRYKYNQRVWRYFIDFALLDYNIGIECDGEHWHENTIDEDAKRDSQLLRREWTIVRVWGAEIKEDVIKALSKRIPHIIERALIANYTTLFP